MTDTQKPVAEIVYLGQAYDIASLDLTEYGLLIVTLEGRVQLLPWHTISGIEFYDESAIQIGTADLPNGHEGSE